MRARPWHLLNRLFLFVWPAEDTACLERVGASMQKQAPRRAGPATPQGRGEKSIMQNKHQHPSPQPQPVDLPGREARMDLWLVLCCLGFALAPMFAVAGACACR
ncbi:hypothetical protein IWX90DRAFT_64610 [Phyllosticta citrichinensis]|uniref:Uncharacterized protein n=1 Tax=Phyllosticta citrichinensis TaxID=1130410 RepID=A0ABR1XHD4_9PEZI